MGSNVVVGIDLGTTFTGVAITSDYGSQKVEHIQRWPGLYPNGLSDKVPTRLFYKVDRAAPASHPPLTLCGWGFLDPRNTDEHDDSEDILVVENFKLDLIEATDVSTNETDESLARSDLVSRYYVDYLTKLYKTVASYIEDRFPENIGVEYLFSVPDLYPHRTTWRYLELVRNAGFGSRSTSTATDTAAISLMESEAAILSSLETSQTLKKGDVILSCDAGGGTTDCALMEVVSVQPFALREQAPGRGVRAGAEEVHQGMCDLIKMKLSAFCEEHVASGGQNNSEDGAAPGEADIDGLYLRCINDPRIRAYKNCFSDEDGPSLIVYPFRGTRMRDECITIGSHEVARLFDKVLDKIIGLTQYFNDHLEAGTSRIDHLDFFVLSGGFGSSEYVQRRLRQVLAQGRYRNLARATLITQPCPQMAVAFGIVRSVLWSRKAGSPVIKARISRFSLGVLRLEVYDEGRHLRQDLWRYPLNGKLYVQNMIYWFMRMGEEIQTDGPAKFDCSRILMESEAEICTRVFKSRLVISHEAVDRLPSSLSQGLQVGQVSTLCEIQADLRKFPLSDFEQHRYKASVFKKSLRFYLIRYSVVVTPGPADLRLEVVFKGKRQTAERSEEARAGTTLDWADVEGILGDENGKK